MAAEHSSVVGKRIIICNETKQLGGNFPWQCGVIRCTSARNGSPEDFSVCVEWDGQSWEHREWIHLREPSTVLIEKHFVILNHPNENRPSAALVFQLCKGNLIPPQHALVELFKDRRKMFVRESELQMVEELCDALPHARDDNVREWISSQKTQKILLQGSTCLAGCRVLVYGGFSSVRWINAVITKQLDDKQLNIMTEQVLTHTTVDPLTTQVRFLDTDLIDDVINGQGDSNWRRSRRLTRTSGQGGDSLIVPKRRPVVKEVGEGGDRPTGLRASTSILGDSGPASLPRSMTQCDDVTNDSVSSIATLPQQQRKNISVETLSNAGTSSRAVTSHPVAARSSDKETTKMEQTDQSEILLKMQQSQQQALSNLVAQQAMLQENQKQQSQAPPQPATQHISPHLLAANPYLNPYAGLQMLYNNQATAIAQAQLHAAALAAAGNRPTPMMMPWLKTAQQGALDKELHLTQQQVLYAALCGQKALDGMRDYTPLLRAEPWLPTNSSPSPAPRTTSPRRGKQEIYKSDLDRVSSPQEVLAKKLSHSPSPRHVVETPVGLLGYQQRASPRTEPHKSSPHSSSDTNSPLLRDHRLKHAEEELLRINEDKIKRIDEDRNKRIDEERIKKLRDAERENQKKEDSWKLKYFGGNHLPRSKNGGERKEGMVEGVRTSKDLNDKPSNSWSFDPSLTHTITRTPLGMIDPATYLAAHGAQFIRDDAVRQNGIVEKVGDPPKPPPPFVVSSSMAQSYKTWQPPMETSEAERRRSPTPKSLPMSVGHAPAHSWANVPPATSPGQGKSINSSVVNIHSLKYRPSPPAPAPKLAPHSPKPDKNVIIKTTPAPCNREGQSIKYISDKTPLAHRPHQRSPSPPEQLGPVMADGSRARVLSPESLRNLYRFPDPSSKSLAKVNQSVGSKSTTDAVIIKTGHYKVTEVHGGRENPPNAPPLSSGGHLVYPKHVQSPRNEATDLSRPPPNSTTTPSCADISVRKRAIEENEPEVNKKIRAKSPPAPHSAPPHAPVSQPPHIQIPLTQTFPTQGSSTQREMLPKMSNLHDVTASKDPHLRGLVGAGVFPISGSNITWGDSSRIASEYPGAPTKVALKDALLGVKKENGLNLTVATSRSTHDPSPSPHFPPVSSPPHDQPLPLTTPDQTQNVNLDMGSAPEMVAVKCEKSESPIQEVDAALTELPPTTSPTSAPLPSQAREPPHPAPADLSLSSANISVIKPGDDVKAKLCTNLKKAWIKRSYESDDAAKLKGPTSFCTDNSIPLTESPGHDRAESDSAADSLKKIKKKHKLEKDRKGKEIPKKKRKHKEKEVKRSKKAECSSPDSTSSDPREEMAKNRTRVGKSNSKLFLLGNLSKDATDTEDVEWIRKRRSSVQMPLGENGLPISVLLCRKEQSRLKKSGEAFVQDAACHEIVSMNGVSIQTGSTGGSALPKCRECRSAKRKENNTVFCRFYGFRKLAFAGGHLQASGFCDPEDSHVADLALWLPTTYEGSDVAMTQRPVMELETCRYIMKHIGGKFCELVQEEREALQEAEKTQRISWKRPVHGVREMCDACETTLFNLHWVCQKCGFGICSDCYCARKSMSREDMEEFDNDKNNMYRWLKCGKGRAHHHPSHLVPTQIIPSSCLFDLCDLAHQVRAKWNITSQCCKKSVAVTSSLLCSRGNNPTPLLKNHCNSELLSQSGGKITTPAKHPDAKHPLNREGPRLKGFDCENSASPLDWLASIALREQRKGSTAPPPPPAKPGSVDEKGGKAVEKSGASGKGGGPPPPSSTAPRSWLCNGQLLQLTDSSSSVNVDTFQLHWFYGMPVMASGASSNLNRNLWKPETFSAEHGDQPTGAALINCRKGSIITNALIRDFWNGFEKIENRLCDERTGEKMILKLKDWPTADDFIDTMPDKFDDLMRALPLPQYTAREGKFNMAAHLPDFFVRPDLGPKMYIAYGWVTERDWNQGTTNLHLDISDACNLMVYVGIPEDEPPGSQDALIKIIREGDADEAQVGRARTLKPGALWHIFKAADTDKIRKLILKVKAEKGIEVSDDHDPIHDQQIYLDQGLRRRLREEYAVEGYPLVQCEGDSVFIPAGAPHQVFNLHSCIKVAEDFVSPEHVDKCFKLTEEFRHLSTTHSNHEDKLQLKNIIYHTMKEVIDAFHRHEAREDIEALASKPCLAQT